MAGGAKKLVKVLTAASTCAVLSVILAASAAETMAVGVVSVGLKKESAKAASSQYSGGSLTGLLNGYTAFNFFLIYETGLNYACIVHDRNGACYGAYAFTTASLKRGFIDYCYEYNQTKYRQLHNADINNMDREWLAAYNADPEEFAQLQDDYAYQAMYQPVEDYLKTKGIDISGRSMVVKGECFAINVRMGRETSRYSYILRSGVKDSDSDEEFLKKIDQCFGNAYRNGTDPECNDIYAPSIYYRWLVDNSSYYPGYPCELSMALGILKGEYGGTGDAAHGGMPADGEFQNGKYSGKTGVDYLDYAMSIANDDTHGYDPHNRYYDRLVDYSCSQLVYYSLKACGYNVGSTQFWCNTMDPYMIQAGFQRLAYDSSSLHTGDIVVNPESHTQIYISDGYYVMSQADYDGMIGDTGNGANAGYEVCIVPDGTPYTYIYRWPGN